MNAPSPARAGPRCTSRRRRAGAGARSPRRAAAPRSARARRRRRSARACADRPAVAHADLDAARGAGDRARREPGRRGQLGGGELLDARSADSGGAGPCARTNRPSCHVPGPAQRAGRQRRLEARPAAVELAVRQLRAAPPGAPCTRAPAGARMRRRCQRPRRTASSCTRWSPGDVDRQPGEVRVAAHDEPAVLAGQLLDRRAQRQLGVALAQPEDRARDRAGRRGTDSRRTSGRGAAAAASWPCAPARSAGPRSGRRCARAAPGATSGGRWPAGRRTATGARRRTAR